MYNHESVTPDERRLEFSERYYLNSMLSQTHFSYFAIWKSALKMEAGSSSETLLTAYQGMRYADLTQRRQIHTIFWWENGNLRQT
jgi:hypothetical protein